MPGIAIWNTCISRGGGVTVPSEINDGNTLGWYKPTQAGGAKRDGSGVEDIWYDMMYGNAQRGPELSSGTTAAFTVYEITACQTDFFYTGCAVGDIFTTGASKTFSALNKAKMVLGNHLCQKITQYPTYCPTNGVFNGTSSFLQTKALSIVQPTFVYIVFRQITWTVTDVIFGGDGTDKGSLYQYSATPKIAAYAGAGGSIILNDKLGLNTWAVVRVLFNGANSLLQVNETAATTGNFGSANMDSFVLGKSGSGYSNIEVKETILRKSADDATVQQKFFNYLQKKNNIVVSAWQNKTVNFVGDSITAAEPWLGLVSAPHGLIYTDCGVSGSTVADTPTGTQLISMVERVCGLNGVTPITDKNLWVILGGVNDLDPINTPIGAIDEIGATFDTTTFCGAYQAMVENILARPNNPKLLIMVPLDSIRDGALMQLERQAIIDIGILYNVPSLDLYTLSGIDETNFATYTLDGLHPNLAGQILFYQLIVDAITDITP